MTNTVHVWRCMLDTDYALPNVLDRVEQERAVSFAFPHLRRRYVNARTFLRLVIADCIGIEPSAVAFAYTTSGKPHLRGSHHLPFNLSHAEGVAYLGIAESGEIGIDVELDHRVVDALEIGRTVFSAEELTALSACSDADRTAAFLNCWTRKEAYVKALGLGVGLLDLRRITVGLLPIPVTLFPLPGVTSAAVHLRSLELDYPEKVAVATTVPLSAVALHDFDRLAESA